MKRIASGVTSAVVVVALLGAAPAAAQESVAAPAAAAASNHEMAKKLSNPIADLVSVPFQFNWAQGVGPGEETRFILNVQPVMPFALSKDVNLIARVIAPFIGQPALVPGGVPASGLGDITASFFFSPNSKTLVWGVGPVFTSVFRSRRLVRQVVRGPFVLLKQSGPWTVGALWNQVWSFSGSQSRKDVSQMFFQPFLSYTTKKLVTFSVNSESTANWQAEDDQWTVPINFVVAKLTTFGVFPASYQLGVGAYVVSPEGGPTWQLRAAIVIILPRRR
jgi:hypothetical protein